jgi:hypothetical protein
MGGHDTTVEGEIMTPDALQCPECVRLQMIENAAWAAWLEIKGLKPMTEDGSEKRNAALSATYAIHFHRKKCEIGEQITQNAS